MEPTDVPLPTKPKPAAPTSFPVRLKKPTIRSIKSLVTQCNKKPYGRRISPDDVIAKAITLLTETHLDDLKAATYSSEDRLEIEFKKYCQANGSISKAEFLEKIMNAGLPLLSTYL